MFCSVQLSDKPKGNPYGFLEVWLGRHPMLHSACIVDKPQVAYHAAHQLASYLGAPAAYKYKPLDPLQPTYLLVLAVCALEHNCLPNFEGKYEDWEENKNEKKCSFSGFFWGGHFYYEIGRKMPKLAKRLAARGSNANYKNINITGTCEEDQRLSCVLSRDMRCYLSETPA